MKLVIVIPAFNESSIIYSVVKSLPKKYKGFNSTRIVVVNDGSTDNTKQEASRTKVDVISHPINRGVGAATKTGITWAKNDKADVVVTFDGDGQHNPADIPKLLQPILKKRADIVVGSRFKSLQKVPFDRFIINWCANAITYLFFGVFSTDTQSGLRAMSKKAINFLDFKTDRMEFSSELLLEAKKYNLKIVEVPTSAIYTTYSRAKGQKNTNAFPIMARFLVKWLR